MAKKLSSYNKECMGTICNHFNRFTDMENCTYQDDPKLAPCRMTDKELANYLKKQELEAYKWQQVITREKNLTGFFGFVVDTIAERDGLKITEDGSVLDSAIEDATISIAELARYRDTFLQQQQSITLEGNPFFITD